MTDKRRTAAEAGPLGDAIGVDWSRLELEQFRAGMDVEFEHGSHDPQTDATGETPDYYDPLERMEREAEWNWEGRRP